MTHGTASKMSTEQFREFAGAVLRSLPDDLETDVAQGWIGNQESLRRVLREALSPNGKPSPDFVVWETLTVGGTTRGELLKRLEKKRIDVSNWARDIMGQPAFTTSVEPQEVSFVKANVRDLGFTEMPTTTELFDEERLANQGLRICEPEDGPHLRLADTNQPKGTWYWVAMLPITDSSGSPDVFRVGRNGDGKQWLRAPLTYPDDRWNLVHEVVFRLCK